MAWRRATPGGIEPNDPVVDAIDPGLAFLHQFGLETAVPITGHRKRRRAIGALHLLGHNPVPAVGLTGRRLRASFMAQMWRDHYNTAQPHSALGYFTPIEHRTTTTATAPGLGAAAQHSNPTGRFHIKPGPDSGGRSPQRRLFGVGGLHSRRRTWVAQPMFQRWKAAKMTLRI